jgi:hypothetical protein
MMPSKHEWSAPIDPLMLWITLLVMFTLFSFISLAYTNKHDW